MKKIVLALALMMATMTVAAENILYFTYNQAARTVACLNNQDELMIYCGYEDELPTYVLVNEVWAEQISSSFYEIWLYGYDAYTGDEIYMPIDLECIYLMQNRNIYSAAQYLRFKYTHRRPTFVWAMPPYNPLVRAPRPVVYYYTYHYDIHRPGWHYHSYPHMHYHPYYCRHPHHPAPIPPKPFTPGQNRPGYQSDPNGGFHYTGEPLKGKITTSRSQIKVQNDPTNRSGNRITSNRGDNTITTTDRATGSRNTTPAPSRTGEVSNRGDNNGSRSGISSDNGRGTNTNNRGGVNTNDNSRGSNTNNRGSVSSDNGRGTNTNNRGGVSTNDNSRGTNANNRSGVSSDNNNRSTNTSTSRNSSTKESGNNRSGVSSDNGNSRGSGTSSRTSTTKENGTNTSSRSGNSTSTRSSSNNRSSSATNSTNTSSNSRSGNATNSRGTAGRTRN